MFVPQTDTGRRGEYPQVYGRTFVQELGKKVAVPSEEGLPDNRYSVMNGGRRDAANDLKRLFTKNTGPCEAVRQCIGTDAWPVSERYGER